MTDAPLVDDLLKALDANGKPLSLDTDPIFTNYSGIAVFPDGNAHIMFGLQIGQRARIHSAVVMGFADFKTFIATGQKVVASRNMVEDALNAKEPYDGQRQ